MASLNLHLPQMIARPCKYHSVTFGLKAVSLTHAESVQIHFTAGVNSLQAWQRCQCLFWLPWKALRWAAVLSWRSLLTSALSVTKPLWGSLRLAWESFLA